MGKHVGRDTWEWTHGKEHIGVHTYERGYILNMWEGGIHMRWDKYGKGHKWEGHMGEDTL